MIPDTTPLVDDVCSTRVEMPQFELPFEASGNFASTDPTVDPDAQHAEIDDAVPSGGIPPDVEGDLQRCERVIGMHLVAAFFATGKALREIRDKAFYKLGPYGTFDEYLRRRWHLERTYACRLIQAAQVYEHLLPIGNSDDVSLTLPTSEAQVRPLVRLDPDSRRKAWRWAVKGKADSEVPTAAKKAHAAEVVSPRKPKCRKKPARSINPDDTPGENPAVEPPVHPPLNINDATSPMMDPQAAAVPAVAVVEPCAEQPPQSTGEAGSPPEMRDPAQSSGSDASDCALTGGNASNPTPATETHPAEHGGGDLPVAVENKLVPPEKVQKAVDAVRPSDLRSLDGTDLVGHVRRAVPLVAQALARYAELFPELEGHDLCQVFGMANTKLQVAMRWL